MDRWTAPAQALHRPYRLANVVACGRGCHAAAGAADRRRQHPEHRCVATARTGWLAGRRNSSREEEEPGKAQGILGANRQNYKCWCWRNELRNKNATCALSVLIVQGDYVVEQSGRNSANITMQSGLRVWPAQVPSKSKLALHASSAEQSTLLCHPVCSRQNKTHCGVDITVPLHNGPERDERLNRNISRTLV